MTINNSIDIVLYKINVCKFQNILLPSMLKHWGHTEANLPEQNQRPQIRWGPKTNLRIHNSK
jgi:hypothetical protein